MQGMGNAYEMISRENALISGALIDYRLSEEERKAFGEYVTTRNFLHNKGAASLDPELGKTYRDTFKSAAFVKFTTWRRPSPVRPATGWPPRPRRWKASMNALSTWLDKVNLAACQRLGGPGQAMATGVLLRILIAGGSA